MRVYLGSDHAGHDLRTHLLDWLTEHGHDPVDCGPPAFDPADDYPPYCLRTAARTAADPGAFGIVLGGSGNGEAIAANKVPGVRCALAWSEETARLARQHNDANVLALGARLHGTDEATSFVAVFLTTPYSGAERHARRIAMLTAYEADGTLPPLPDASRRDRG